jgi:hypothetical protein
MTLGVGGYNEKSARKTPPVEDVVFGDEEAVVGDSEVKEGRQEYVVTTGVAMERRLRRYKRR